MKRLTTDTPKDNLEAALNLFYIKDHETWVRGYGSAPEYADVSLFDLTRDIVKTHIPDAELPADDDALSNMMPEWLMDGIESAEGIVALLYTAAWAYAELRHKLMRYEDTGLEPEDFHKAFSDEVILRVAAHVLNTTPEQICDIIQAEQDGRLVVLPCKVGEHVFVDGREAIVEEFFGYETERYLHAQFYDNMQYIDIPFAEIGKTVFLTREEAEAALAQKGGSND